MSLKHEKKFSCKYCNNSFTQKNNMYSHIKNRCKVKKEEDNNRENIFDRLVQLENENKELKNTVNQIKTNINNCSNITNTINNSGTITNNNIVLIGYGMEDIKKIDKNDILKSLKRGFYSTIHLTEAVHFNPKYPEYHNVYISNIKDKYGMMYDGKDWKLLTKSELIDKIYNKKKDLIESEFDDFYFKLTQSQKNALERWMNTDDEHDKIKEVKERIKLLLYNKRKMVMGLKEDS